MPAWVDALKELSQQKPTKADTEAIIDELLSEGHDRGAALVAATLVEESLRNLVKSQLRNLSKEETDALFSRDAPLASFSKLIRVSYAFGMMDNDARRYCNVIREIRNTFAHGFVLMNFKTPAIETACNLLPDYYEGAGVDPLPSNHPRMLYMGTATILSKRFNDARDSPGDTSLFPVKGAK